MQLLRNVNDLLFTALSLAVMASGLAISVVEYLSNDVHTNISPFFRYINMSGWAFWQMAIMLFVLTIKNHLTQIFDTKLVLCYNVLLSLVLVSDLNYIFS